MFKRGCYSFLLLAWFLAGAIHAEEPGDVMMPMSAEGSSSADASVLAGASSGNGGIDRTDPNFVKASLLVFDPSDVLFSSVGHACLRMECPAFGLDFCFSYESEGVKDKVLTFFAGKLKMGMFAIPTREFLAEYEKEHRGVRQYKLNLPPEAKQRLWKNLDEMEAEGANLPYDYGERGCAWSVLKCIGASVAPLELHADLPEIYAQTRRERIAAKAREFPWNLFFIDAIIGTAADRDLPDIEKTVIPDDLLLFLQTARIDGVPMITDDPVVLLPSGERDNGWRVTPAMAAYALLVLALVNLMIRKPWIDWAYLALQSAIGLFLTYMVCFSSLPGTDWNWLIVPFNLLPLIFWKWRKRWALAFAMVLAVWGMAMLLHPHRLTDQAYIVMAWAYVVFYLKHADRSHIFKGR